MLLKQLDLSSDNTSRILSLEFFHSLCGDFGLLRAIYVQYERQHGTGGLFYDLVAALSKLADETPAATHSNTSSGIMANAEGASGIASSVWENMANSEIAGSVEIGLNSKTCCMKLLCMDQLEKTEIPAMPAYYAYYLAMTSLLQISESIAEFVIPIFVNFPANNAAMSKSLTFVDTRTVSVRSSSGFRSSSPVPVLSLSSGSTEHLSHQFTATNKLVNGILNSDTHPARNNLRVACLMAEVAWPAILASHSSYFLTRLDNDLFNQLIHAHQQFTCLAGLLKLSTPRDAFITILCKHALPPISAVSSSAQDYQISSTSNSNTTIPERNTTCLMAVIKVANILCGLLSKNAWKLVLETVEEANLMLHGRTGIASQMNRSSTNRRTIAAALIRPHTPPPTSQSKSSMLAKIEHLPSASIQAATLVREIDEIYENTKSMEDEGFFSFIEALVNLAAEWSGIPIPDVGGNAESQSAKRGIDGKSYSIDRLRQISLQNMSRLLSPETPMFWDAIIDHLAHTMVNTETMSIVRMQAADAFAEVLTQATVSTTQYGLQSNEDIQLRLLMPIRRVLLDDWNPKITDVKVLALDTLQKLLQTNGQDFTSGWLVIFEIIHGVCVTAMSSGVSRKNSSVIDFNEQITLNTLERPTTPIQQGGRSQSESLVKTAFPCLQLICTDFLSLLIPSCLTMCIRSLGAFGQQQDDLNISLTSIGLLWNVSDFIQTEKSDNTKLETLQDTASGDSAESLEEEVGDEFDSRTVTALWLILLLQLKSLGSDLRPEVRNSANQSLFRTVAANGAVLGPRTWERCMDMILFPLVEEVDSSLGVFVKEQKKRAKRIKDSGNLSEKEDSNEAAVKIEYELVGQHKWQEKQWDESRTLVINGIVRVFRENLETLVLLPDILGVWSRLLLYVRIWLLHGSAVVSQSAVDSWKWMLGMSASLNSESEVSEKLWEHIPTLWWVAWEEWEKIGKGIISDAQRKNSAPRFTIKIITPFIQSFADIYSILKAGFALEDVHKLLKILKGILNYPQLEEFISDTERLSQIQSAVMEIMLSIDLHLVEGAPEAFVSQCADFCTLARKLDGEEMTTLEGGLRERKATFIALTRACLRHATTTFKTHCKDSKDASLFPKLLKVCFPILNQDLY